MTLWQCYTQCNERSLRKALYQIQHGTVTDNSDTYYTYNYIFISHKVKCSRRVTREVSPKTNLSFYIVKTGTPHYSDRHCSDRCYSDSRPTKSPASRGRLPHFGAISRSPAASLKSPASPALNLVSWFSAKWLKLLTLLLPDVIY